MKTKLISIGITLVVGLVLGACNHTDTNKKLIIPPADHSPVSGAIVAAKTEAVKTVTAIGEIGKSPDAGTETKARVVTADTQGRATVAALVDAESKSGQFVSSLANQKSSYEKALKDQKQTLDKQAKQIEAYHNSVLRRIALWLGTASVLAIVAGTFIIIAPFLISAGTGGVGGAILSRLPTKRFGLILLGGGVCIGWLAINIVAIMLWTGILLACAALGFLAWFIYHVLHEPDKPVNIPPIKP